MTSRSRLRVSAVLAIVLLVGSFLFVGFSAAEHRTTVNKQVTTAASNGASMSVPTAIQVYVVGPEPIRGQVTDSILSAIDTEGIDARVVSVLAPVSADPVLLVGVRESRLAYNPITPSASVSLRFEYAANGDVRQFGQVDATGDFDSALVDDRLLRGAQVPIVFDTEDALFRSGDLSLSDASTGLTSWPGYQIHVADALGSSVVSALLSDAA